MNTRHLIYAGAALGLVALNVWRWWPSDADRAGPMSARATRLEPQEYTLRVSAVETETRPVERDLFEPPVSQESSLEPLADAPPESPLASPQEVAPEQPQSELARLKVIGIVFQGGIGRALVMQDEQSQMVNVGDVVGERFRVAVISVDSVEFQDLQGEAGGRVPLSGS